MITIIIVNWNAGNQLYEVISSIAQYHHNLISSVVIVDNASADTSLNQVESLHNLPFQINIIRNTINVGFGAACNQGAELAKGDYFLFLNPDAALYTDTIKGVLAFMQDHKNKNVGICGVQLVNESGQISRSCARFPSAASLLSHAIGLDRIFPRLGHLMGEWSHDTTRQVDHVIGAFFLVRRSVFEALGGFDERFFVYLEDLDFSFRACQVGWRSMYLAVVQAFHAGGGTSNQVKAKRLFYSLRSRLLFAAKHFNLVGVVLVFLVTFLLEPLSRSIFAFAKCSWPTLKETWQGYGMLWRWLPQWIIKGVTR